MKEIVTKVPNNVDETLIQLIRRTVRKEILIDSMLKKN
ncbi:hypothetical protein TSIB_1937 [Thermococcus sibiricus MM 739]|uniref:Uncharacterized protein n=1 Tax=Thermococcus sibiricus (strain DSM 12597 / MM 739) TaxID=604354 RepID=C6A005_THESM|nr:hypothetical protein TSIB_1937 [Thermococcus sibiricus MM 739]